MQSFFIIAICLSICFGLGGCVYQAGGVKTYEVTASTEKGTLFVELFNVKYICEKVYGIYWTDFFRSQNCSFVSYLGTERFNTLSKEVEPEVEHPFGIGKFKTLHWLPDPTGITDTRIRFIPLNKKYCNSFGLKPNFTWWHKYGSLVLSEIIMFICWATFINLTIKTHGPHGPGDWWAAGIILLIFLSFAALAILFLNFIQGIELVPEGIPSK